MPEGQTQAVLIDPARHVTQFNPLPEMQAMAEIPTVLFLPQDRSKIKGIVIVMHGIGSSKQYMYPVAEHYADEGFASILIDLPWHGELVGSL